VASILRRLGSPLLQLGDLAFDCEVSVQRGGQREVSDRRLAAGSSVAEHSRRLPRTYVVEGAVSGIVQPQNLGRPGGPSAATFAAGLAAQVGGAFVPIDQLTRLQDFEQRLDALLDDTQFGMLELVSKRVGRRSVIMTEWTCSTTGDDGQQNTYRLSLREVQRAGLTIAEATAEALALTGTGGAPQPGGGGPSQSTPMVLDAVPG
jgi:hypothetical protein